MRLYVPVQVLFENYDDYLLWSVYCDFTPRMDFLEGVCDNACVKKYILFLYSIEIDS